MFGVDAISIVKFPAIEENFVFFNNDFLSLAKVDEEKKQLVGAILVPDKKIPRLDKETNEEYDVCQRLFAPLIRDWDTMGMNDLILSHGPFTQDLVNQRLAA